MPSTETPTWWADVQQDREELAANGRRVADDWLGEDIDFVPRRRMARAAAVEDVVDGADHPLHGMFVAAPGATSQTIVLEGPADVELVLETDLDDVETAAMTAGTAPASAPQTLSPADDPYASPPPAPGQRRTVQIKGRPEPARVMSNARRHRPRTASDVVGHRPDRIVLWAVALGAILILLAAMTSSSQAAEIGHHAAAAALTR